MTEVRRDDSARNRGGVSSQGRSLQSRTYREAKEGKDADLYNLGGPNVNSEESDFDYSSDPDFGEDDEDDEDDTFVNRHRGTEIPSPREEDDFKNGAMENFSPEEGDLVDVRPEGSHEWREGIVETRNDKSPNLVQVRFLFEDIVRPFNLDNRSTLAPYGTHCFVPEFNKIPKPGQIVEFCCNTDPRRSQSKQARVECVEDNARVRVLLCNEAKRERIYINMLQPYGALTQDPTHRDNMYRGDYINKRLPKKGRRKSWYRRGRGINTSAGASGGALTEIRLDDPLQTGSIKGKTRRLSWSAQRKQHKRGIGSRGDPRLQTYLEALRAQHMEVVEMRGDGNCLFRAVSHQVYGDASYHREVRAFCMDYMEIERSYFEPFVVGGAARFSAYIANKRRNGVWGDDLEIQAMCEIYNRPARVWAYDSSCGAKQLRTFHEIGDERSSRAPILLSFYGGGHYDSLKGPGFGEALLSSGRGEVGEVEGERIAISKARRAGQTEDEIGELVTMRGKQEQDEMDMAIMASRQQYMEEGGDLEQALAASLIQASEDERHLVEGAVRESENDSSAHAAVRLSDVEATEQQAILDAIRASEQAQIEQAVKESSEQDEIERMYIEQALRESESENSGFPISAYPSHLYDGDWGDDDDLQKAIQMSLQH